MPDDVPHHGPLSFLFGLEAEVRRAPYFAWGASLMALKYLLDVGLVGLVTHRFWSPFAYLSPLLKLRERDLGNAPSWLFLALAVMTLPFLWVGVSMSVRRAVDAGWPAWVGLGFFVPVVNYGVMIALAIAPTRVVDGAPPSLRARACPVDADASPSAAPIDDAIKSALQGVVAGVALAAVIGLVSITGLRAYGATLFLGTPVWMGAVSAYLYNRPRERTLRSTVSVAMLTVSLVGLGMLLFALEGVLCLAMAFPIAAALAVLGAIVGRAIARSGAHYGASSAAVLLLLPGGVFAEHATETTPLYAVTTSIVVDAPPEKVFPNVVGFSDLDPPTDWFFKAGIAYPMRARIDGHGVGAVRRCEFSTGAFVEPITRWEEPTRLSFDVAEHPAPMHEWSPYRHVTPAHLDGYLRSKHGEFRLTALPGGRTLLEGTTWYEIRMAPAEYWTLWTDALLHAIHGRVLEHVKRLSEGTR